MVRGYRSGVEQTNAGGRRPTGPVAHTRNPNPTGTGMEKKKKEKKTISTTPPPQQHQAEQNNTSQHTPPQRWHRTQTAKWLETMLPTLQIFVERGQKKQKKKQAIYLRCALQACASWVSRYSLAVPFRTTRPLQAGYDGWRVQSRRKRRWWWRRRRGGTGEAGEGGGGGT